MSPSLYLKRGWWYLALGKGKDRKPVALRLPAAERAEALKVKAQMEAAEKAGREVGLDRTIVRNYRKGWTEKRIARGLTTAKDDDVRIRLHAKAIDGMRLSDVRIRDMRDLVHKLRGSGLASRTQRHVFMALHRLFEDAIVDELITFNPAKAALGELPPKKDKNPEWRETAVFSRAEAQALISDPLVPAGRRALYTLLFCTGVRIGEAAALTWARYQPEVKPLGRLTVAESFNRKLGIVKTTKTDVVRRVPVHPTLAKALAQWRASGWAVHQGLKSSPRPTDLLFPTPLGDHLKDPVVHANLHRDLEKLGLPMRRTHDTRHAFISLALADGARRDVLTWVTHGPKGDVMSAYTQLPWETLCEAVNCLKIRAVNPATRLLPAVSASEE